MGLFLDMAMNHKVQDIALQKNLIHRKFGKLNLLFFLIMIWIKNVNRLLVAHSGLAGYVKQSQKYFTERRLVPI